MKILALDMGTKRMGVAVSDPLGITAQGLPNIDRADMAKDMELIKNIIETNQIGEIVVGLPLNMDGSEGPKAKEAIAFGDALKGAFNLPVTLWDERLTTRQVERVMIEANTSRMKRKIKIDKLAAQIILQGYLDSRRRPEGDEHV